MNTRRLLPLGLAVTALLVLAGIASHGRPLSGGRGRGPTATFFDYVATTLVIFAFVMLAVVIWSLFAKRDGGRPAARAAGICQHDPLAVRGRSWSPWLLVHSGFVERLRKSTQHVSGDAARRRSRRPPRSRRQERPQPAPALGRDRHRRRAARRHGGRAARGPAGEARAARLAARAARRPCRLALDESLDDLRNDPDLRRAIVAAYARMERALGRAGLPRHPAEAPFEYVERALASLDTSAESVRRLTALFEWAKFSQHEPEPEMRDEAIDALVAVRDELRRARTRKRCRREPRAAPRRDRSSSARRSRLIVVLGVQPVSVERIVAALPARARGDRARRAHADPRRGSSTTCTRRSSSTRSTRKPRPAEPSSRSSCASSARSRSARRARAICTTGSLPLLRDAAAARLGFDLEQRPMRRARGSATRRGSSCDRTGPRRRTAARPGLPLAPRPLGRRRAGAALMELHEVRDRGAAVLDEVERAIVGKRDALELILARACSATGTCCSRTTPASRRR